MVSVEEFSNRIQNQGWIVLENVVAPALVSRMAAELEETYETCRYYQKKNKIDEVTAYTLHHLVGQSPSFLEYLETMSTTPFIEQYFGGTFILNSFGGAINTAGATSYAQNIHRDIRSFSGELNLMLNTLVMLDDFIEDNGSTWLMNGSHRLKQIPTEEEFVKCAEQALGSKGSVLMFNSNLWHRGGDNNTTAHRRSVTPMYTKPFYKPQFDYCRALGYDKVASMSEHIKQTLGYFSRVPSSLDEWYQPRENRSYRPNQG